MNGQSKPPLAIVTGGNRGIGLEVCRQLAQGGARVILAARDGAAGTVAAEALEKAGLAVTPRPLDVSDPESIAAFAAHLSDRGTPVDVLVNNAGVALDGFNAEVVRRTMAINLFGAMELTDTLRPLLSPEARVVMVSSGMGALSCLSPQRQAEFLDAALSRERLKDLVAEFQGDTAQGRHRARGWPASAYKVSKAALNAYTRILARELDGSGPSNIKVNAVCPGWVRTRMGGSGATRSAAEAADTIVYAALLPPKGPHGAFLRDRKLIPW